MPSVKAIIVLAVTLFLLVSITPITAQNPGIELAIDTGVPGQDGVLAIYGSFNLGGDIGYPVAAGDITSDGRADVISCAMYASAGAGTRINNGHVSLYISDGRDSGTVDTATRPPNVFGLVGAHSGDLLGTSVAVGDVNNDGVGDAVIGASGNDGFGAARFNSGAAYVVPGSPGFNLSADLQTMDNLPPPGITAIYGPHTSSRLGIWVDTGDLDGDGINDIVVGADQLNSSAGQHVGGAFIVFGMPSLPRVVDLASPPAGARVARVLGANPEEHNGAALHVGDINGDGIGDLVLGASIFRDSGSYVTPADQSSGHNARGANFGGLRPGCGEVNVIYGTRNWPAEIDLRQRPATTTRVIGAKSFDLLGSQLFSADLNGDLKRELIIGALQADAPDFRGRTGAVYVIYGSDQVVGATIDLANPGASEVPISAIFGENHLDCAGDSVRSYDINNDGMSDLFIGSPEHTFEIGGIEREDAGDTKVIFGQPGFLPPVVKLFDLPAGLRVFRLAGAEGEDQGLAGGDEFSYRLSGGDVDGDGFFDYLSNAMHGDGLNNRITNAGEVYVFSGKKLSQKLGMLPPPVEPAPTLIRAQLFAGGQVVSQANAGQSGLRVVVEGNGLRADTQISINGAPVVSQFSTDPMIGFPRHIAELDQNPGIRNSVGELRVRARNTNPPSETSNEVSAGRLIGPEITSIGTKRKAAGAILLRVFGTNFQPGMTAQVLDANSQPVPVKNVIFVANDQVNLKIRGDLLQPGQVVRVRLSTSAGIQSNQVSATVP